MAKTNATRRRGRLRSSFKFAQTQTLRFHSFERTSALCVAFIKVVGAVGAANANQRELLEFVGRTIRRLKFDGDVADAKGISGGTASEPNADQQFERTFSLLRNKGDELGSLRPPKSSLVCDSNAPLLVGPKFAAIELLRPAANFSLLSPSRKSVAPSKLSIRAGSVRTVAFA